MFNKYRGQPQVKKINRSFDKEVLVRKPQPKPPVEEEADGPPVLSSFDDVSEARMRSEAENDLLRQQEEDEWFRLFKGDPKTESGEDKQSDKMDSDGETGSNGDTNSEEEQLAEEPDPAYEDPKDDSSEAIEQILGLLSNHFLLLMLVNGTVLAHFWINCHIDVATT